MPEIDKNFAKVQLVTLSDDDAGQRIDNYLFRLLKGVPKSRVYRAIRDGEVRVNKKRIKPAYKIEAGVLLRIPPFKVLEKTVFKASNSMLELIERSIIFENKDIIVVNKPSGIAVHGGSGLKIGLIEAMRQLRPLEKRLELVHRLDRDTSGITLIAKKSSVLKSLHFQLREKTMEKTYYALVKGRWPSRKAQVTLALDKNILKSGERYVRPSPEGKRSKTLFSVAQTFPRATLVEAKPVTGRTHQIRVHTQASGYPILGDPKYGVREDSGWEKSLGLNRLFLHACRIRFHLPVDNTIKPGNQTPENTEQFDISAPLPDELASVLKALEKSS